METFAIQKTTRSRVSSFLVGCFTSLCALTLGGIVQPAQADITNAPFRIHDPSREVYEGGRWWVFSTGNGIAVSVSTDRWTWQQGIPLFGFNNPTDYWAPEVINVDGTWYVFYSVSSWNSQVSRIGVVKTSAISAGNWQDLGTVISSTNGSPYNTIDPCVFLDPQTGRLWLAFGSYWNGIYVVELDRRNPNRTIGSPIWLARNTVNTAIEAPTLYFRNGWYYLLANIDQCCQGGSSPYRVIVGRSRFITGPYVDKDGRNMIDGGGTSFMGGAGAEAGPGHVGFVDANNISYHVYPYGSGGSDGRLAHRGISWPGDWPVPNYPAPLSAGVYTIQPQINTQMYVGTRGGSTNLNQEAHLDDWYWVNSNGQRWRLVPVGDGTYNIQNVMSGYWADINNGNMLGGDYLRQWYEVNRTANDAQKWRLIGNGDGSYSVQSVRSGMVWDLSGNSPNQGTILYQWPWWSGGGQRYIFTRVGN